jgi:hypothetical protein
MVYCLKLSVLIGFLFFSSCLYRMPSEDDVTTLPTTNNPNVTRDSNGPQKLPVPGISY